MSPTKIPVWFRPLAVAFSALISPLFADGVTGRALVPLASSNTILSARPAVATSPLGHTFAVWATTSIGGTTLWYAAYDQVGNENVAPSALPVGLLSPIRVRVAASSVGFAVVFSATGGADGVGSGIYYSIFDHNGLPTMSAPALANVLVDRDEDWPSVAGSITGGFALVWSRSTAMTPASSQGVYLRRVDIFGTPIDPIEIRVDDPANNRGHQRSTDVACWTSGRLGVVWQDGAVSSPSGSGASGDGWGTAVRARWLAANLGFIAPTDQVLPSLTDRDQLDPRISADHRDRCIVGWTHETSTGRTDAVCRRFDHDGVPLMADVIATTGRPTSKFLTSVTMGPSGEHAITWMDVSAIIGGPGSSAPLEVRRFTSSHATIETFSMAPTAGTHGYANVACDTFGNLDIVFRSSVSVAGGGTTTGVALQHFKRSMVRFSSPTLNLGGTVTITLDSPSDAGGAYQVGVSAGPGLIPIDTRWVKVAPDEMLMASLFGGGGGLLFGGAGMLDANGLSSVPSITIPSLPELLGHAFYVCFGTMDANAPNQLNTISDTSVLPIQ